MSIMSHLLYNIVLNFIYTVVFLLLQCTYMNISGNVSDNDILHGESGLFTDIIPENHTYFLKISAHTMTIQAIYNISEFFRYVVQSDTIPA